MLNIYYGNMPEAIFNTAVYFKNVYEDGKRQIIGVYKKITARGILQTVILDN